MRVRFWGTRGSIATPGPGDEPIRREHFLYRGDDQLGFPLYPRLRHGRARDCSGPT